MTTTIETNAEILADPDVLAHFFGAFANLQTRTGMCTCCPEARPMVRFGDDRHGEWGHSDDATFAEHRHVHVETTSSDCDGRYDRTHVLCIRSIRPEALRPDYLGGEPSFYDLWTYVVRHEPVFRDSVIECSEDRIAWSYRTDEGGGAGDAWVCDDTYCSLDAPTFRDHTAERAGY